jgi:hypothetical protein
MSFTLTLVLLAMMIAVIDVFVPPRAAWARRLADWHAARVAPGPVSPGTPVGLLSEDLVATRLRAVSDEIAYLDRDRSRFALAFRTRVAWDAYRALQDDALRLAEWRARAFDVGAGVEVDVSMPTGRGSREELEL